MLSTHSVVVVLLLFPALVISELTSPSNDFRIFSICCANVIYGSITKAGNSNSTTTTELVDSIIKTGIEKRASDIHIEPQEKDVRIRYRIDGELYQAATIKKDKQSQLIGRLKAISNMHQEKQEAQDGRILIYDDYNIRVSSQPNVYEKNLY